MLIATRMRALGNIMHECTHSSYAPNKKGNLFFGNLIAILLFSSFSQYRKSHFLHHRYLGNKEKDDDYKAYLKLMRPSESSFFLIIFNPINWIYTCIADVCFFEKNKLIVLFKIIYFLTLLYFFNNKYVILYVVVYLTFYQMMKIFSNLFDHHKNYQVKNKLCQLIFFPRNDIYHLVHHKFPRVPVTDLGEVYRNISSNKGQNV